MYLLSKLFYKLFHKDTAFWYGIIQEIKERPYIEQCSNVVTVYIEKGTLDFWVCGGYSRLSQYPSFLPIPFTYKAELWDTLRNTIQVKGP